MSFLAKIKAGKNELLLATAVGLASGAYTFYDVILPTLEGAMERAKATATSPLLQVSRTADEEARRQVNIPKEVLKEVLQLHQDGNHMEAELLVSQYTPTIIRAPKSESQGP